jgi:integrase
MTKVIIAPTKIKEIDIPNLPTPRGDVKYRSHKLKDASGFQLRVYSSGKKAFVTRIVDENGKRRVVTLGHPPSMTIKAAQEKHQLLKTMGYIAGTEYLSAVAHKKITDLKEEIKAEQESMSFTIERLAPEYLKRLSTSLKAPANIERVFRVHLIPLLAGIELDKRPARWWLDTFLAMKEEKGHNVTRTAFLYCNKFLNYCSVYENMPQHSLASVKLEELELVQKRRKRVLTPIETGQLLRLLDEHKGLSLEVKCGLELLLLTAARSGELLKAEWRHIDLAAGEWHIPAANSKTNEEFDVMLAPRSIELLRRLKKKNTKGLVMGGLAQATMNRAFHRLQYPNSKGVVLLPYDYNYADDEKKKNVVCHDLRRTARTYLTDLGVNKDVAERYINHARPMIEKTYDTSGMEEQRLEAAILLADKLEALRHG